MATVKYSSLFIYLFIHDLLSSIGSDESANE